MVHKLKKQQKQIKFPKQRPVTLCIPFDILCFHIYYNSHLFSLFSIRIKKLFLPHGR